MIIQSSLFCLADNETVFGKGNNFFIKIEQKRVIRYSKSFDSLMVSLEKHVEFPLQNLEQIKYDISHTEHFLNSYEGQNLSKRQEIEKLLHKVQQIQQTTNSFYNEQVLNQIITWMENNTLATPTEVHSKFGLKVSLPELCSFSKKVLDSLGLLYIKSYRYERRITKIKDVVGEPDYSKKEVPDSKSKISEKKEENVTVNYDNGDSYYGEILNGVKHGKGRMTFSNGTRFEGEYLDGKENGKGVFFNADSSFYISVWKNGIPEKGKLYFKNGDIHADFEQFITPDRSRVYYTKSNSETGFIIFEKGDIYEGGIKHKKRSGKGKITNTDGSSFDGVWDNDSPFHGNGTVLMNGDKYIGDIVNGQKNGKGTLFSKNQYKYEGEFKDDKYFGKGKLINPDFSYVIGTFDGDSINGKYYQGVNLVYEGDYKNGSKEGKGTYYYKDGSRYEGEWKNGKRNGMGKIFTANGHLEYNGSWLNDQKAIVKNSNTSTKTTQKPQDQSQDKNNDSFDQSSEDIVSDFSMGDKKSNTTVERSKIFYRGHGFMFEFPNSSKLFSVNRTQTVSKNTLDIDLVNIKFQKDSKPSKNSFNVGEHYFNFLIQDNEKLLEEILKTIEKSNYDKENIIYENENITYRCGLSNVQKGTKPTLCHFEKDFHGVHVKTTLMETKHFNINNLIKDDTFQNILSSKNYEIVQMELNFQRIGEPMAKRLCFQSKGQNEKNHDILLVSFYSGNPSHYILNEMSIEKTLDIQSLTKAIFKDQKFLFKNPNFIPPISNDDIIKKWTEIQNNSKINSKAIDKLLKLTGIEKVKMAALEIAQVLKTNLSLKQSSRVNLRLNYIFIGNPGTGKTTVARLFGELLYEIGARKTKNFVNVSASELVTEGAFKFEDHLRAANDGVLFIDEAYQLNPLLNQEGAKIVDRILIASENNRDSMTIILAGYKKDLEEKLFSYNPGLKSRFTDFIEFTNFNESQLKKIWEDILKEKDWKVESDDVSRIVARMLVRSSKYDGFANARSVHNLFQRSATKVLQRSTIPLIKITDIMGDEPNPETNHELQSIISEFHSKIGWNNIKQEVDSLIKLAQFNYAAELKGQKIQEITNHRLFIGNPGTGKTTCAKLYGKLLKNLNLLSNGDVEYKIPSDFIGNFIGETENKTAQIIESARGKVLVIDEAYSFFNKIGYGQSAIDTLVSKVSASPGEDIAVILCGYKEEMTKMMRESNPGLQRRFPKSLVFEDYSKEELYQIFKNYVKRNGIEVSKDSKILIKELIAKKMNLPNFGNAGEVESIVTNAVIRAQKRDSLKHPLILIKEDFQTQSDDSIVHKDLFYELDKLHNVQKIKETIEKLYKSLLYSKKFKDHELEKKTRESLYFLFLGGPGVGKTTVARSFGKILYKAGLLSTPEVVETTASEISGTYVGQAKNLVIEKMKAAKGGVLFIDEAYELGKGAYGQEAMTQLLTLMTSDDHCHGKTVIILAGYQDEIEKMLNRNPGMKRRFKTTIKFPDWNVKNCIDWFFKVSQSKGYKIQDIEGIQKVMNEMLHDIIQRPGWGNAGDMETIFGEVLQNMAIRSFDDHEGNSRIIHLSDVENALNEFSNHRTKEFCQDAESILENLVYQSKQQAPNQNLFKNQEKKNEKTHSFIKDNSLHETKSNSVPIMDSFEKVLSLKNMTEIDTYIMLKSPNIPDEFLNMVANLSNVDVKTAETVINHSKDLVVERLEKILKNKNNNVEKEEKIQKIIIDMGLCPNNFPFLKVKGGYVCCGGSHFVSDETIEKYLK